MEHDLQQSNRWEAFKASPNPLAKAREVKAAIGETGPGLNALYREWRSRGTMLGVDVLEVSGRPYLPRQAVVDRIEGRCRGEHQVVGSRLSAS